VESLQSNTNTSDDRQADNGPCTIAYFKLKDCIKVCFTLRLFALEADGMSSETTSPIRSRYRVRREDFEILYNPKGMSIQTWRYVVFTSPLHRNAIQAESRLTSDGLDRVFGFAQGSYGEHVVTTPSSIIPMPDNMPFEQAAIVSM